MKYKKTLLHPKTEAHVLMRLAFLLRSGTPLHKSLILLARQLHSKKQKNKIGQALADIEQGHSLYRAWTKHCIVSSFSLRLINIGEISGTLSETAQYASVEITKARELKRKIIGAALYPVILALATFGLSIFLTMYIFPKILPLFMSVKMKLPLSTRILLGFYTFITRFGLYALLLIVSLIIATAIFYFKKENFKFWCQKTLLKIPFIGQVIQTYCVATDVRIFSLLLSRGETLGDALLYVAEATALDIYRKEYFFIREKILDGENLAHHFQKQPILFPSLLSDMVATGEETGTLAETLKYLGEQYEEDLGTMTKNLPNILEPALMIVMGGLVGFIAISIIAPVYQITQNLNH